MSVTLAVIGGGNMAKAIIEGAVAGSVLESDAIAVADPDEMSRLHFEKLGCRTFQSAEELPSSPYVLLAVKPQVFPSIAQHIHGEVIYSIMAGVTIGQIEKTVGCLRIVRIMPNLPCSIGYGAAGLAVGDSTSQEDALLAHQLFSAIGIVTEVQEGLMDAVTAVSGSGPAYLFLLAEAMVEGGVLSGLDRETADALVRQTLIGASALLLGDERSAGELREAVTSKGGTTAAALDVMNTRNVPDAISDAIVAARDRGRELGA
ncbi:MAG: pyrroline-5-carboxylate reductase [Phycisphaerales bacterium]|nr:pyrroline-5-carboxylate reductase [Planctomycetota bacterium]MBL6997409.1 pyrroline-5-carboxylate reductase [Phycisphaerales bacterium]